MKIKYHHSCQKRYTDKQTLARIGRDPQSTSPYDAAFNDMKGYINTKLFEEMKVLRMADLLTTFRQLLSDAGVKSPDYRAEKLKKRLINHYGRLSGTHNTAVSLRWFS